MGRNRTTICAAADHANQPSLTNAIGCFTVRLWKQAGRYYTGGAGKGGDEQASPLTPYVTVQCV